MIITHISSSSYNRWKWCPLLYYIEYVLKWTGPSNSKADKGTTAHKIIEILAKIKKAQQNCVSKIQDDIVGDILCDSYDLDKIIEQVYQYYDNNTNHNWTQTDFQDIKRWVYKVIEYENGYLDPRNRKIIDAEKRFDIEFQEPWSKYQYTYKNKIITGQLKLKGIIDLVLYEDNILNVFDLKTGQRRNWITGQEKTYADIQVDLQLKIYHLACSLIYKQTNVICSLFYPDHGGLFSVPFSEKDLQHTKHLIQKQFEEIKNCQCPQQKKSWKCRKLCHAGKKSLYEISNGLLPAKQEFRDNYYNYGQDMTACEHIFFLLNKHGMKYVNDNLSNPNREIYK